jgi:hypothetical protein
MLIYFGGKRRCSREDGTSWCRRCAHMVAAYITFGGAHSTPTMRAPPMNEVDGYGGPTGAAESITFHRL